MTRPTVGPVWSRQTVLKALVVCAGGLGGAQQGEQPPHGHLVVEDALARVETSVCHSDALVVSDFWKQ